MKKILLIVGGVIALSLVVAFTTSKTNIIYKGDAPVGLNIGNKIPNIKLKDPKGKEISLYSLKGKMVLVDFWASWCGPCRRENPNNVKAYNEFHTKKFKDGKGFTIFGVSLDRQKSAWEAAIKADGLKWPYQVSDLGGWRSKPAQRFGIHFIPYNFLINGKGIIVAKNLRGERLEQELSLLVK